MAWGAVHNIVHVFFEKPPAPEWRQDHPFPEWRRYAKLHRLPDSRHHRRDPLIRLETTVALQELRYGWEVRGFLLINDN
jgi:hypothetical protein